MLASEGSSARTALCVSAARKCGLTLLVLFGSRARGKVSARSDWDFGFLADGSLDRLTIMAELAEAVGSDRVDLVDLSRASGLLRYRAAREGVLGRPSLLAARQP